WRDVLAKLSKGVKRSGSVRSKLTYGAVSKEEYAAIVRKLAPEYSPGWDALYLYKLDATSPDLLIGTFRRVQTPFCGAEPVTLRHWAAVPMNEALSWRLIEQYREFHEKLWRDARPM